MLKADIILSYRLIFLLRRYSPAGSCHSIFGNSVPDNSARKSGKMS